MIRLQISSFFTEIKFSKAKHICWVEVKSVEEEKTLTVTQETHSKIQQTWLNTLVI